jgi:hypothetical protein
MKVINIGLNVNALAILLSLPPVAPALTDVAAGAGCRKLQVYRREGVGIVENPN